MMCKPPEVPLKTRWLFYAGAWGAAFLGCTIIPALLEGTIPDRDSILLWVLFSWLFPSGLAAWFNHPRPLDDIGLIAVLWLAYLVHGVFTLRSRTRVRFYLLVLILAVTLSFNVLGCHRIQSRPVRFGSVEPSSPAFADFSLRCHSCPETLRVRSGAAIRPGDAIAWPRG